MGEKTGGAHLALQRDLEIPPFIVGIVLKKREANSDSRFSGTVLVCFFFSSWFCRF